MPVEVYVRDNDINAALRVLKKMQREGTFREMRLRRFYEKLSERRAREKAQALRHHPERCASGSNAKVIDIGLPTDSTGG